MEKKIVSLTICRNEKWVIGLSLRTALQWCDACVVVDHMSTDGTRDVINKIQAEAGEGRVIISEWSDTSKWDEMQMRQHSLDLGRKAGGTHFAIVDSDEVPTANVLPHLRGWMERLKPGHLLDLPMMGGSNLQPP